MYGVIHNLALVAPYFRKRDIYIYAINVDPYLTLGVILDLMADPTL